MILTLHPHRTLARWRAAACVLPMLAAGLIRATPALAQDVSGTPKTSVSPLEKAVSVDAENATLASVITTLMQSVGANYTLDNSLRSVRVTAHLHNIRLDIALNILLRNANPPMTYRYEDSVYSFLPKVETAAPEIVGTETDSSPTLSGLRHIQVVRVNFIDAAFAAQILGGIPIRAPEGQTYGLVDPLKLNGAITSPPSAGAGNGGNAASGTQPSGSGASATGGGGQNSTFPPNLFDYLWIVNAGAYR